MSFFPNLIMPGVAKCGTTTLHDILVAHPQVCGGLEKEVRYAMDREDPLCPPANVHARGLRGWAEQYPDEGQGDYRYWLDASPQYQYQRTAREIIADLSPAPNLLFIVRQPAARLYSLYQYARYHQRSFQGIESFAEFVEAVREPVDQRLAGQRMMASAWRDSLFDEMLEAWRQVVPPQNIWITSVEALGADRTGELASLAQFLALDAEPFMVAQQARSNPTVQTRSKWVRGVGARLAKVLPDNGVTRAAKDFVKGLNSAPVDKQEQRDNAQTLSELEAEFAPSVARFNDLAKALRADFPALPVASKPH